MKLRPRHDLQLGTVERRNPRRVERRKPKQAVGGDRGIYTKVAVRVGFIQIDACPEDLHKLRERVVAFR